MQDLLPIEVNIKLLRLIYCQDLLEQALHQGTKESHTDINVLSHAWSTRFHLGLVLGQITCLTAGSNEPRAFTKRPRELLPRTSPRGGGNKGSTSKPPLQKPSPRAKQDMLRGKGKVLKCAARNAVFLILYTVPIQNHYAGSSLGTV